MDNPLKNIDPGRLSEDELRCLVSEAGKYITDLETELYEIRQRLDLDGLTGLYGQTTFYRVLGREMEKARRYGHPLSIFVGDIDHFKRFNDTYGHVAGDKILRNTAILLNQNNREGDFICRYGGEEFAGILPDTPAENACYFAERKRRKIEGYEIEMGNGVLKVTMSFGVAGFTPEHYEGCEEQEKALFELADLALYHAKQHGRNATAYAQSQDGYGSDFEQAIMEGDSKNYRLFLFEN